MDSYVFITTANQSGSNFLQHCFALSKNVVSFPKTDHDDSYLIHEGHHLCGDSMPLPYKNDKMVFVWTEILSELQDINNYDWEQVKKAWDSEWRKHLNHDNRDRIFLEKTPCNVARAKMMSENFENSWFICQVRNPYAVAEGVKRRQKCDIRKAGRHAIKALELQRENISTVNNVLSWRYEDLTTKAAIIEEMVNDSIIGLSDFSLQESVPADSIQGYLNRKATNLNDVQINKLSDKDIRILNEEFDSHSSVMNFFQYERINHSSRSNNE